MQCTELRERFRAILGGASCIHPASVYDPVFARIAEDPGIELGMCAAPANGDFRRRGKLIMPAGVQLD